LIDALHWMKLAFVEAKKALDEDETPVGAVIVKDGSILGRGHNRTRSLNDPTAHAEILAISAACQKLESDRLDGCDLFTTLEPCPMCATALSLARVKRIYWAADDPRMGGCASLYDIPRDPRMPHQIELYRSGDSAESTRLLAEFFQRKR